MTTQREQDGDGCGTLLALAVVIGVVVAGVISIAALVDPFSSLPPIGEIFGDCGRDEVPGGACELADRYPGFWAHVLGSFVYSVATAAVLVWLAVTAGDFRQARAERFGGRPAVERYRRLRRRLGLAASCAGVLGALPIMVALV